MTTPDIDQHKGREFEILAEVAELLDTLTKEQQRQVLAMLATRYGMQLKDPPAAGGRGYSYRPTRKRAY